VDDVVDPERAKESTSLFGKNGTPYLGKVNPDPVGIRKNKSAVDWMKI